MNKLRIIFAGTPSFAAQYLLYLLNINTKYEIVGVLTKPDKLIGKRNKFNINTVKTVAQNFKIPILQPLSLDTNSCEYWIKNKFAHTIVIVAYGLIFPKNIINILPFGCINIHFSLLPRWRGAAPIQRAILAGDKKTGISIIQINEYLDSGDILYQSSCLIENKDTSAILFKKLFNIGSIAIDRTLTLLSTNKIYPKKQNNKFVIYAEKIKKNEALINWHQSACQILRCIRAFNPWPISFFIFQKKFIKVWDAYVITKNVSMYPGTILYANKLGMGIATGKNILNITKIQPEGKKIMSINDFLNSRYNQFFIGKNIISSAE